MMIMMMMMMMIMMQGKLLSPALTRDKMPRNASAPHFVLANRNLSTVFTPIARVGSTVGYSVGSGNNLQVGHQKS